MAEVLRELVLRHKEFFESKLALSILATEIPFQSQAKVSHEIVRLLRANQATIVALIERDGRIVAELRAPYFGSLYTEDQIVTPQAAFDTMLAVLNDPKPDLCQVMQIHGVFVYRIYDHLAEAKDKRPWQKTLQPEFFFSADNRARLNADQPSRLTRQLGISQHPVFNKRLGESGALHHRALDKFKPNRHSSFFQQCQDHQTPFVCGPSGHTSSLLMGAKLYANLSAEELKEYVMIAFAFLAAGGNHSCHEVMSIAQLGGVAYQEGHYADILAEAFKSSKGYEEVSQSFSQFI